MEDYSVIFCQIYVTKWLASLAENTIYAWTCGHTDWFSGFVEILSRRLTMFAYLGMDFPWRIVLFGRRFRTHAMHSARLDVPLTRSQCSFIFFVHTQSLRCIAGDRLTKCPPLNWIPCSAHLNSGFISNQITSAMICPALTKPWHLPIVF